MVGWLATSSLRYAKENDAKWDNFGILTKIVNLNSNNNGSQDDQAPPQKSTENKSSARWRCCVTSPLRWESSHLAGKVG